MPCPVPGNRWRLLVPTWTRRLLPPLVPTPSAGATDASGGVDSAPGPTPPLRTPPEAVRRARPTSVTDIDEHLSTAYGHRGHGRDRRRRPRGTRPARQLAGNG